MRGRWIWTVHRCTPLRDGSDGGSSLIQYQFSNGSELCGFLIWASKWWSSLIRYGMLNGSILLWNWSKVPALFNQGHKWRFYSIWDVDRWQTGPLAPHDTSTSIPFTLHDEVISQRNLERKKLRFLKQTNKSKLGFLIRVGIEHDAPLQTTTPSF